MDTGSRAHYKASSWPAEQRYLLHIDVLLDGEVDLRRRIHHANRLAGLRLART